MRIVTLEEHIVVPDLLHQLPATQGKQKPNQMEMLADKLADFDGERLQSMDRNGISLQVISAVGRGAETLPPDESPAFAAKYNDAVAEKIASHADRFAAFAHLPMNNPEAAAAELERAVRRLHFKGALINGTVNGDFLDAPAYLPVLQKAVELDCPIYLHPGPPPAAVYDAYYDQLPGTAGNVLSLAGWGWHSETAIHVLRLVLSGRLDQLPELKIIIGHMGEMLPVMMARCDDRFGVSKTGINKRPVSETLRSQVYITTSGIFTLPPFRAALDTFGIDRILFSVDYPFSSNEEGRRFLYRVDLPPADWQKLAHGNADRLLKTTG